jgi:hypothetical protein
MADPAFWRELAATFLQIPGHDLIRADGQYTVGSGEAWTWRLAGSVNDFIRNMFESLATRGAFEIAPAGTTDLANAWLEAIRKERINFRSELGGTEVDEEGHKGRQYVLGTINGLCEASAALCRLLERRATQAEFEEKQRNNPKNWTQFRQRIEAFESMKEVRNEPPYRISEAVVRNIIADIDSIKPEEVTWKRIAFEIAGLSGPNRRHIEVVPTPPPESPPTPDDEKSEAHSEPGPSKQPQVEKPEGTSVAAESVAAQIMRLRDECRWTSEDLAEAAELSTRQVARHVSGEAMPYKRNIAAYERVFSKKSKRQIVISKKS